MMNRLDLFHFHRSKMQESSVKKKTEAVEMAPQLCLHSLDNDSSSSVSLSLTLCFSTGPVSGPTFGFLIMKSQNRWTGTVAAPCGLFLVTAVKERVGFFSSLLQRNTKWITIKKKVFLTQFQWHNSTPWFVSGVRALHLLLTVNATPDDNTTAWYHFFFFFLFVQIIVIKIEVNSHLFVFC